MKQEIIKILGKETLSKYFEDRIDVRDVYEMMDEVLNALDISEDDLSEDESDLTDNFPWREM